MRENPSKARPKKKDKQSSVADVGHGDGCYATLSRGTIGGGVVTTNTASHFTHPFLLVHYCNPLHWGSSSQSTSSAGPTSLQTEVDGGWLHHAHLVKTNSFNKWDYKIGQRNTHVKIPMISMIWVGCGYGQRPGGDHWIPMATGWSHHIFLSHAISPFLWFVYSFTHLWENISPELASLNCIAGARSSCSTWSSHDLRRWSSGLIICCSIRRSII